MDERMDREMGKALRIPKSEEKRWTMEGAGVRGRGGGGIDEKPKRGRLHSIRGSSPIPAAFIITLEHVKPAHPFIIDSHPTLPASLATQVRTKTFIVSSEYNEVIQVGSRACQCSAAWSVC